MKNFLTFLALVPFLFSCEKQEKTDLSKLKLNESIEKIINFDDKLFIGVETVEYPFCLLIEVAASEKYSFDGIDLEGQKIYFQIDSEKLKTDSLTRFGGGHVDIQPLKNQKELQNSLTTFNAATEIYGVRIEMNTPNLQTEILKKLESKYGKGTKNTNSDNGLYWNIQKEHKYIFFAPDYERVIILNNTNLSKTCYWDTANGLVDFGGCEAEKYSQELVKNATKPEDVANKPIITIDKNWNINGLLLGKTTEKEFLASKISKSFEKMEEIDGETGNVTTVFYRDAYHDCYFYFETNKTNPTNKNGNTITSFTLDDLKKVNISFENGLQPGMSFNDALQLFDKKAIKETIINEGDLKFANYIIIANGIYKVSLVFNENMVFSGIRTR